MREAHVVVEELHLEGARAAEALDLYVHEGAMLFVTTMRSSLIGFLHMNEAGEAE